MRIFNRDLHDYSHRFFHETKQSISKLVAVSIPKFPGNKLNRVQRHFNPVPMSQDSKLPALIAAKPTAIGRASSFGESKRFYLPELDTLRFFAFLAVFLRHSLADANEVTKSWGIPHLISSLITATVEAGMFGVDLFFLLSSFLITSLLLREQERCGRIDVKGFWIRRALRIWPLYFVFVAVAGFLLPLFFHFVAPPEPGHVVGLLTFTQNWAIAFSDAGRGSPTLVLWSVSMEEQFYLIWPVVLLLAGVRRLRAIAIGMIVFAFFARIVAIYAGASAFMLWCATPFRLEPIAVGALIALNRDRIPNFGNQTRLGMLCLGAAIPVICMLKWSGSLWINAAIMPLATIACALVLLSVIGADFRLFTFKPLIYLGTISYGLYVFHQLAISFSPRLAIPGLPFGRTISAFLLTVALAALSYRFLETPFLRMKDRFAHIQSRPV